MRRLLIVWWSVTGASRALAQAAADAARADGGCVVDHRPAPEVGSADLLAAQGYLFVTPEMLGSMAGPMKDLFERSYYDLLGQVDGRPYGLIVSAGSDGSGTVRQVERIVTGWRLRRVMEPLIVCTRAQTPEAIRAPKHLDEADLALARERGATLAAGVGLGVW